MSTTHALVGALIGAGLAVAPQAVRWQALAAAVALPLLASVAVAYLLSTLFGAFLRHWQPDPGAARLLAVVLPLSRLSELSARALSGLHWLSAGAVGAGRGLNDTPKIAAVAGFALLPAGVPAAVVVPGVGVAMAGGALVAGGRVAHRLGEDVVRMDHLDGLRQPDHRGTGRTGRGARPAHVHHPRLHRRHRRGRRRPRRASSTCVPCATSCWPGP